MKKILTFGVFDYFHFGHLTLLEQAAQLGDYLVVAVQEDKMVLKFKPNTRLLYSLEQRRHILESLRIVNETVVYNNVCEDIKKIEFDVFAIGEDQIHQGFQGAISWCKDNGKEIVQLKYTKNISSTMIKARIH